MKMRLSIICRFRPQKGDAGKNNGDGEEHDHSKICWHSRNSRTTLLIYVHGLSVLSTQTL